jgi:hypothetical protein
MEDGFYAMYYSGAIGNGIGILAVKDKIIYGADISGGTYDGTFSHNPTNGQVEIKIRMTFPQGVALVTGAVAGTEPLVIELATTLPANFANEAPVGPVNIVFKLLRPLPK